MIFIFVCSSGLTLANKVGLDTVTSSAWTDKESKKVALNVQICFKKTYVENKKQKSNCLRIKSVIEDGEVQQYANIIFETKNTQFKFKTNSGSSKNRKFWLRETASKDTINFYSFLSQLSNTENALIGAMCKKIADTKWLTVTVDKAVNRSNDINPYVINRFRSIGYQDVNRISKRCQATVEQKIGKIELVKITTSKIRNKKKECEYTKNKLYDLQSTLSVLGIYNSKIDGRYGPGTKKAIKIGKERIYQFANRTSDCLSANELSWLKLLVSVKRKGQECGKFNSFQELKEIAKLFERIGQPVFSLTSAFDKVLYTDSDYKNIVYAIIDYENSLDNDYFKMAQRNRDCRLIELEKMTLVATVENNSSKQKNNSSAKQSETNRSYNAIKEKAEEELAKQKAEEELAKKKAEEELAKKKAEEELAKKKVEEELAKKKAIEELEKKRLEEEQAKQTKLRQIAREALKNKIATLIIESQSMLLDIKVFMKMPNDFDVVKVAKLVLNFNNTANIKWNEETVNAYEELKKYVMSFDDFFNFRQGQIALRQEEKEKKIRTLKAEIKVNAEVIKKFIAENIGSKDIEDAIELLEIIENNNGQGIQKLSDLKGNIRNFMLLNNLPFEEIDFPLEDPNFDIDDKVGTKQKEIKKKSIKTLKKIKSDDFKMYVYNSFELTKEVGDGFTNFEASKDYLLSPWIFQRSEEIKDNSKDIKSNEGITFSFLINNKKKLKPDEEASEAFASQQDLSNYFQKQRRYTVQTKNLAMVFNVSKRDLDNAECASFIIEFDDSYKTFEVKGFETCN